MKLIEINTSHNDVGDTRVVFCFAYEGRTYVVAKRFSRNESAHDVAQKLYRLAEHIAGSSNRIMGESDDVGLSSGDAVGTTNNS